MTFTLGGILFMAVAWTIITGLCVYSMVKVMRNQKSEDKAGD